tara:strand:+ start:519 stop:1157 length:639 start_codon:yes stop_codon:yes gene_type:complete
MFDGITKENLHHAYLLEGNVDDILPEILLFIEHTLGITLRNNPDVRIESYDVLGIKEGRNIAEWQRQKTLAQVQIGIFSARTLTHEAQNALLKVFEEPTEDTCFFLILPRLDMLLSTLRSRVISLTSRKKEYSGRGIQAFLDASYKDRLLFVSELQKKEGLAIHHFLDELEYVLSQQIFYAKKMHYVYDAKKKLSARSSAHKAILEHVALML